MCINGPRNIQIPQAKLAAFCEANGIVRLSLFGSVLSEDFQPDSDVDILIEFAAGRAVGLIHFAGLEIELSEMLGRKVDLRTPEDLNRRWRDQVVTSAEVQYEAA